MGLRFSDLVRAFNTASHTADAESGGGAFEPGDNRDSALDDKIEFLQQRFHIVSVSRWYEISTTDYFSFPADMQVNHGCLRLGFVDIYSRVHPLLICYAISAKFSPGQAKFDQLSESQTELNLTKQHCHPVHIRRNPFPEVGDDASCEARHEARQHEEEAADLAGQRNALGSRGGVHARFAARSMHFTERLCFLILNEQHMKPRC